MNRERGGDYRARAVAKHSKQRPTKVQAYTIYATQFPLREQNKNIYRWVRPTLFNDRHEQNRKKKDRNKDRKYFLHRKMKSQDRSYTNRQTGSRMEQWTPEPAMLESFSTTLFATLSAISPENSMPEGNGPSNLCTWRNTLCQVPVTSPPASACGHLLSPIDVFSLNMLTQPLIR